MSLFAKFGFRKRFVFGGPHGFRSPSMIFVESKGMVVIFFDTAKTTATMTMMHTLIAAGGRAFFIVCTKKYLDRGNERFGHRFHFPRHWGFPPFCSLHAVGYRSMVRPFTC